MCCGLQKENCGAGLGRRFYDGMLLAIVFSTADNGGFRGSADRGRWIVRGNSVVLTPKRGTHAMLGLANLICTLQRPHTSINIRVAY